MTVAYEWDVELVDEHGDIENHDFLVSLTGLGTLTPNEMLVLVRDDAKGRSWAYAEDGILPVKFEDAYGNETANVPQRYRKEFAAWRKLCYT